MLMTGSVGGGGGTGKAFEKRDLPFLEERRKSMFISEAVGWPIIGVIPEYAAPFPLSAVCYPASPWGVFFLSSSPSSSPIGWGGISQEGGESRKQLYQTSRWDSDDVGRGERRVAIGAARIEFGHDFSAAA